MFETIVAAILCLAPVPKEVRDWQREQAMRFSYAQALAVDANPTFGTLKVRRRPDGTKETYPAVSEKEHELLSKVAADKELSMVVFAAMRLNGYPFDMQHYDRRGCSNVFDSLTEVERYWLLWDCGRVRRMSEDWGTK